MKIKMLKHKGFEKRYWVVGNLIILDKFQGKTNPMVREYLNKEHS